MANGDIASGFENNANILAIRQDGRSVAQYTDRGVDIDNDGDKETQSFVATPIAGKKVSYAYTNPAGAARTIIFKTTEKTDVALDADIFTEDF